MSYLILRRILLLVFVLITVSQSAFGMYLAGSAPTSPNKISGTIYPVRIHRSTVYLTREQRLFYNDWIFEIGFWCGAPIMVYELILQSKRSRDDSVNISESKRHQPQ